MFSNRGNCFVRCRCRCRCCGLLAARVGKAARVTYAFLWLNFGAQIVRSFVISGGHNSGGRCGLIDRQRRPPPASGRQVRAARVSRVLVTRRGAAKRRGGAVGARAERVAAVAVAVAVAAAVAAVAGGAAIKLICDATAQLLRRPACACVRLPVRPSVRPSACLSCAAQ